MGHKQKSGTHAFRFFLMHQAGALALPPSCRHVFGLLGHRVLIAAFHAGCVMPYGRRQWVHAFLPAALAANQIALFRDVHY
jgi:hypothetical protein